MVGSNQEHSLIVSSIIFREQHELTSKAISFLLVQDKLPD